MSDKPDIRALKKGACVRVHWDDASSHDEGWAPESEIENRVQKCTTVGFVVKRDRKQVVLAMSRGKHVAKEEMDYATTWALPLGWITRVETLP